MHIFLDNIQIEENNEVTIEIDIEEMLEEFGNVVIKIICNDEIINIDKYGRRDFSENE